MQRIQPLANDFITIYSSNTEQGEYVYTPGIAVLPKGRVIITMDHKAPGINSDQRGMIFVSEDSKHYRFVGYFPFVHARPFFAGDRTYIIGQAGRIFIMASEDGGETWGKAAALSPEHEEGCWHASATNVWYEEDRVYLAMEHQAAPDGVSWPVAAMAPVLLRARVTDDLTLRESWTFSTEIFFRDVVEQDNLDFFGVPFYKVPRGGMIDTSPHASRTCAPIGWLETNVVRIKDPHHYWFDPYNKTYHLLARAHTGGTGYAAMCKVRELPDGSMRTELVSVPSGVYQVFLPMPGGQMRFHILYDCVSSLYWLLGTQAIDSMTRSEYLPADRYSLPNNERRRLVLHFSRNCVDWCFAGMVAMGAGEKQSRHYASMAFHGDDLLIASRSGDERAKSAHDGNLITLHRVQGFRNLVY